MLFTFAYETQLKSKLEKRVKNQTNAWFVGVLLEVVVIIVIVVVEDVLTVTPADVQTEEGPVAVQMY